MGTKSAGYFKKVILISPIKLHVNNKVYVETKFAPKG